MILEIRNEKGYTLLVVLLVVTFIMIISASFVTASVSNAKQEKTVDTNNLAVVAAEMGVDYYKTAMLNEFTNRREELINQAQMEINELIARPDYAGRNKEEELNEVNSKIGEMLVGFLNTEIQTLLDGETETPIDGATKYELIALSVELVEEVIDENENGVGEVIVTGKVSGSSTATNYRELDFKLKFNLLNLENINLNIKIVDGVPEIDFENPSEGAAICNESNKTSTECLFDNLDGSTVYFNDGYVNPNSSTNNKDFSDSNIYVNGNIDVKNMNGLSEVYINASGDFLAQNFQSNLGIHNSTIVVGGSLEGKNILVTNSIIVVNGDFIASQLQLEETSKVCIGGDLRGEVGNHGEIGSVNLTINETSEVYLREEGVHKYIITNQSKKNPILLSNVEFLEICTAGSANYPPIDDDWNEPIIDVEY